MGKKRKRRSLDELIADLEAEKSALIERAKAKERLPKVRRPRGPRTKAKE